MTLSLQGYLQLKQTWRELGLEHHFVGLTLTDQVLISKALAVAYTLLKQGQFNDALVLMEVSQAAGLENVWLSDCRARALFYLERISEAQALWQELLDWDDPGLQRSAQKMLSACASRLRQRDAQWIQDQLSLCRGDLDAFLDLWTQYPQSKAIESAVHALIQQRLSLEHAGWLYLDAEQRGDLVALESEVVWLATMRDRVTTTDCSVADL